MASSRQREFPEDRAAKAIVTHQKISLDARDAVE
jgi:hypothetical protein